MYLIGTNTFSDARRATGLGAALTVPDRRPWADALIAATALHHGLTLVTRNEKDFDIPGLAVVNPFSG